MSRDLTVSVEDRPGQLARLGEALSSAGINIEGLCGTTSGGRGEVHVLVADPDAARAALSGAGLRVVAEREVLLIEFPDQPGSFATATRRLAEAGVNVEFAYFASSVARHAFGVDDLERARAAFAG